MDNKTIISDLDKFGKISGMAPRIRYSIIRLQLFAKYEFKEEDKREMARRLIETLESNCDQEYQLKLHDIVIRFNKVNSLYN